jgi:hypothetical protein
MFWLNNSKKFDLKTGNEKLKLTFAVLSQTAGMVPC